MKKEPQIVKDFWNIINYDQYAWIPVWGKGRCGKTTLAMLLMFKIYHDWDMVLNAIVFNLNQLLYKMQKGEPKLFPTLTKLVHMRVPVLLIDDFAAQCGKAKTQHEKVWDLFKGSFDTLGTRIGVLLATMIEPTSPTEQLLLKYTHEIKVDRVNSKKRVYKYDTCERQQDFKGWKHRQKKSWIEEQEFDRVPLDVYKQYDEMRQSLVDEVFVSMQDQMSEDTVGDLMKKIEPVDVQLLRLIKQLGPIHHHKLSDEFGENGKKALVRCKARGLIVPKRKSKAYYVYDITDLALNLLKACEVKGSVDETQISQSSIYTIT
jgi:hypothetical protein